MRLRESKIGFEKNGHLAQARALTAVVSGAAWVGERFAPVADNIDVDLASLPASAFCTHCGEYETLFHRYWACPRHEHSDCPYVATTNWLLARAREGIGDECLWLRGLTPNDVWTHGPAPPDLDVQPYATFGHTIFADPHAEFASDGAGGAKNINAVLRRVAAAFVGRTPNGRVCGLVSDVPGKQTVPRAETWALLCLLRLRPPELGFVLWVDAQYVLNGFASWQTYAQANYAQGANGDVWNLVFELLDTRAALSSVDTVKSSVSLRKVKSHVSQASAIDKGATPWVGPSMPSPMRSPTAGPASIKSTWTTAAT